jgi:hypothetical protein
VLRGVRIALRRRWPIQPRGLRVVLRHALALGVEAAEQALRDSIALRRRQPIQPRGRLRVALRHGTPSVALVVEGAEDALRAGVALRGRQPKQPRGLDKVVRDAGAVDVGRPWT